ncbi:hypothetical protein SRABI134_04143 [Peribacillus sp. Bi134]|nr:hypothetical protein SRABI134_04143 [Peribacillus sp. Bi134]
MFVCYLIKEFPILLYTFNYKSEQHAIGSVLTEVRRDGLLIEVI